MLFYQGQDDPKRAFALFHCLISPLYILGCLPVEEDAQIACFIIKKFDFEVCYSFFVVVLFSNNFQRNSDPLEQIFCLLFVFLCQVFYYMVKEMSKGRMAQ